MAALHPRAGCHLEGRLQAEAPDTVGPSDVTSTPLSFRGRPQAGTRNDEPFAGITRRVQAP